MYAQAFCSITMLDDVTTLNPLVIIPTFNEFENIGDILDDIRSVLPLADVLVVDDGSPDGTGAYVAERARLDSKVHVLQRSGKLGLGTAYIAGFQWALLRPYNPIIGMDADHSHNPAYLPQLVAESERNDLVVGSRYISGGATPDWKLTRRLISRIGNSVARSILALPVQDCTTGYKCYRRETLARIDFGAVNLVGYSFLIETTYQCFLQGLTIKEIPIIFTDRREGKSKMTGTIISEALSYVFQRRWQRVRMQVRRRNAAS